MPTRRAGRASGSAVFANPPESKKLENPRSVITHPFDAISPANSQVRDGRHAKNTQLLDRLTDANTLCNNGSPRSLDLLLNAEYLDFLFVELLRYPTNIGCPTNDSTPTLTAFVLENLCGNRRNRAAIEWLAACSAY